MKNFLRMIMGKPQVGVLEDIQFTWGSHGHQVVTISGKRYAMWMDYSEFPKKGDTIEFTTYHQYGMLCADLKKPNT